MTNITRTKINDNRFEMSIPRIPGVRSEMIAIIDIANLGITVTKCLRDTDGELHVLHGRNCIPYSTAEGAYRAAEKFLVTEDARSQPPKTDAWDRMAGRQRKLGVIK
jgi:hypothetical protein